MESVSCLSYVVHVLNVKCAAKGTERSSLVFESDSDSMRRGEERAQRSRCVTDTTLVKVPGAQKVDRILWTHSVWDYPNVLETTNGSCFF